MRPLVRTISVLFLLVTGCAAPKPVVVRVMSYNIHHGEGLDGKLDLARIARVIRASEADLVGLQEVERGAERTGRVDEPAMLAELTHLHVLFEKNIDFQGGEYGNAILSRWPVESHQNHALPLLKATERRGLLEAHIRIGAASVVFCATHLDASRGHEDRAAAAMVIKQFVEQHADEPVILAGDLNAKPDDAVMRDVLSVLADTCPARLASALTIPADKPKARIDYILYNHHPALRALDYHVIPEEVASDHRPIVATLSLSRTATRVR